MGAGLHNVSYPIGWQSTYCQSRGIWLDSGDVKRFHSKIDRSSGPDACWTWTGARFASGYGQFGMVLRGRRAKRGQYTLAAHRLAWTLANGRPIPRGYFVLHSCDNRRCVNPAHLSLGGQLENMRQAARRGRLDVGPSQPVQLTQDQIDVILRRHKDGEAQVDIAKAIGVSKRLVGLIVKCQRAGLTPRRIASEA